MSASPVVVVRALWEGLVLSEREFTEEQDATAWAYFRSSEVRYRNSDDGGGVTVQMSRIDSGEVLAETYIPEERA